MDIPSVADHSGGVQHPYTAKCACFTYFVQSESGGVCVCVCLAVFRVVSVLHVCVQMCGLGHSCGLTQLWTLALVSLKGGCGC